MPHDPDCIFCSIVAGRVPSTSIAKSPQAYAFLDIEPIAAGHTLVVPRHHYETLMDMPSQEVAALYELAARVAPALQKAVGAEGLNVLQNNGRCAGQLVAHAHVHLVPRKRGDGIAWSWPATSSDPEELKRLAEKVISHMDAS